MVWYVNFVNLFNIINVVNIVNIVNLEVYIGSEHRYSSLVVNIDRQHYQLKLVIKICYQNW